MGIIQQQTIKGTFYSYLGVAIGFITIYYFQPHSLSPEQVGLINILAPFSLLFAQFAILGFNGTARYFPYFRNNEKNHHGYLALACLVSLIGFGLFAVLAYVFKNELIGKKSEKSGLFNQYFWYLLPLTFFTLFFNVFDLFARMLYDTISGRVLREFTKRLFILLVLLLIFFKWVNFQTFMILWLIANIFPTFLMMRKLISQGNFSLKTDFAFINKDMSRKLISICFFAILTGSAPIIIDSLDKYMVNEKFGLAETGIYSVAAYFGIVITLPARSLYSIAYTIVSESWKSNDLENIRNIYRKSCINQLIAALFIFLLVWINVDNIFKVLPHNYAAGKYVIFFIGLGYVIDSATGINGVILTSSRHFKYDSFFNLGLIGITIVLNLIFIPLYGITGAAIAAASTLLIFNLFRYLFILFVYKMQPFTIKSLYAILIALAAYWICDRFIPAQKNFILDSFIRASFITVFYGLSVYFLNLSEDINAYLNGYIIKLKK
ncbi:lipopolysaccharide biosynthesis protein [Mucilaginibacter arboris]|uniref:Polysaccharide biosynthesis protein n=1 Tax=Mucilaginibacter arboris TaxID=2682090 RepID=A0A7K1SS01_9SPHI|nr:polysaccharide biosynthesis C-terminal domain-containing protein [Mucilaginibacter arboris]MVN20007.1 polysaccharide biosynthesis protein [Mucilaginibacter arboris]